MTLFLSEAHSRILTPPNADNSLYACLLPSATGLDTIESYVKHTGARSYLDTLVSQGKFKFHAASEQHTTLCYSRTGGKAIYDFLTANEKEIKDSSSAVILGFEVFGKFLVMLVGSEGLYETNKIIMEKLGGSSDFPEYNPHITIGEFILDESEDPKALVSENILGTKQYNDYLPEWMVYYECLSTAPVNDDWSAESE